nr:uncharacterized protein LOC129422108 isoform X1 [Misgurnus anguillicaudatus]
MFNRMVLTAKTLLVLCMLIGGLQAFPSRITTEDQKADGSFERVRRETHATSLNKTHDFSVVPQVLDVTPPVCRLLNESLYCPIPCGNAIWEASYIMSDGNGSGIDYPSVTTTGSGQLNVTADTTTDENGYITTLLTCRGSCCLNDVEITVIDKAGNKGKCPFNMRYPLTTLTPMTTSSSPTLTISTGSSLILLTIKAMLF